MVVTRFGAGGSGSGSGAGSGGPTDGIDERLRELIAAEVTRGILDATPVIFGTVKEGMMEIMEERLRAFRADISAGQGGARTPSFREFKACGAPEFSGVRDPIVSRRWVADIENAQRTSSCPEEAKVGFASCMLRDRARDWWGEITSQVGAAGVADMSWAEFVRRFDQEFAPPIEVQRMVREFHDLQQTTETMAEITTKFRE